MFDSTDYNYLIQSNLDIKAINIDYKLNHNKNIYI